jgi:hypothetical protein
MFEKHWARDTFETSNVSYDMHGVHKKYYGYAKFDEGRRDYKKVVC